MLKANKRVCVKDSGRNLYAVAVHFLLFISLSIKIKSSDPEKEQNITISCDLCGQLIFRDNV